jgi:hypothetical protein
MRSFVQQRRFLRWRQGALAALILPVLTAVLALSLYGLNSVVLEFRKQWSVEGAIQLLLLSFGFFALGGMAVGCVAALLTRPRIVPYFNRCLHCGDQTWPTFKSGFAIAKNLPHLDELAKQASVRALSEFGFADDFYHQALEWYQPAEGIRTMSALTALLRGAPHQEAWYLTTLAELDSLAGVLAKAESAGAKFCFLVRLGSDLAISGAEMNRRAGHFG